MNPLIRKLDNYGRLTRPDKDFLTSATQRPQFFGARQDIVEEGEAPVAVNLILEGWACRYKQFEDGRRQIISFFLPGDMCDPYVFLFRAMDQSIGTLTPATLARISVQSIRAMTAQSTTLAEAFWWDIQVSAQIQREWIVSLGRRSALERIAHLFCELAVRMRRAFQITGQDYDLPLTQADLGEAMGLSTVHVNRSLQDLRSTGYISLRGRRLTIHDEDGLRGLAMFNPSYLDVQPDGGFRNAD